MAAQMGQDSFSRTLNSQYGAGRSLQKEINYGISRKGTDDLYKFDGHVEKFDHWKRKMIDHFASSTQRYRTLLHKVSEQKTPILVKDLLVTEIDGFNGWEIAVEIESLTVKLSLIHI